MATVRRGRAVVSPNLGMYLGMPPLTVPERGMTACNNVRVSNGRVVHDNMGWATFPLDADPINLDGLPVTLIDTFVPRNSEAKTIFANPIDMFEYDPVNEVVRYITPRVESGTVSVQFGSEVVIGTATQWATDLKPGDFIHIGGVGQRDPSAAWYRIADVVNDEELVLFTEYQGTTQADLVYTARSTFTGDLRRVFDTETFYGAAEVQGDDGDRWYATNGVDAVVAWDGIADQVYRPNLGDVSAAKFVKRFKNIMVYGAPVAGADSRDFSVRTSAVGEPENVVTKEAAEFEVHDRGDPLLTAHQLGDMLVIYAERSIVLAQFVGAPLVFVMRTAVDGFGPRSSRSVAQFPGYHLFLAADGQYMFDGASAKHVNGHVWRDVTRRMSPQRLDMIQCFFDEERGDLHWVVPLNSDPDTSLGPPQTSIVGHYLEDTGPHAPMAHTQRDLPATCFGFHVRDTSITWDEIEVSWAEFNYRWNDQFLQQAFPQVLFGDVDGNILVLNESATQAGVAKPAYVKLSRRPLAAGPTRKGVVRRVYPMVESYENAVHSITVKVHVSSTADGQAEVVSEIPFSVSSDAPKHFVSPRVSGRYCEVEFYTDGPDVWSLAGYDIDAVNGGER